MSLKHTVAILLYLAIMPIYCQEESSNRLEPYFKGIKEMVDNHSFLSQETLLESHARSKGEYRVDACLDLFIHYIFKSTELAKKYNDEAYGLATDLGYDRGYLRASLNQAFIFFVHGEFDNALDIINQVESNDKCTLFSKIEADSETLRSYIYTERGEYDLAYETALNLLEKGEELNDQYSLMRAYSAISHFYLRLGDYEKALDNCLKGLGHILELKEARFIFPKVDEIARMTHKLEGSKKAREIYDFYLELESSVDAPGNYIQSAVYMNIAAIYLEELELEKAEEFLERAMVLIDSNNYRFRKPRAHVLMAALSLHKGDSLSAIIDYNKAYQSAKKIKAFDVVKEVSKSLSTINKSMGNSEEAVYFSNLHLSLKDSLFTIESEQRLRILEASRRISQISRQKEILELKSKSQEERYRFLTIILVILLVSGIFATLSYFKLKGKISYYIIEHGNWPLKNLIKKRSLPSGRKINPMNKLPNLFPTRIIWMRI